MSLKRRLSVLICILSVIVFAVPAFCDVRTGDNQAASLPGGYISLPDEYDVPSVSDVPEGEEPENEDNTGIVLTPVRYETDIRPNLRNQGPYSSCWAHAASALAEFSMIGQGYETADVDYSEAHLAYFTYNSVTDPLGGTQGDVNRADWISAPGSGRIVDRGGNLLLAQNVLAGWVGSADESTAPYSEVGIIDEQGLDEGLAYEDAAHLRNYINVNIVTDISNVKQLIMKNGAVSASIYFSYGNYNAKNNSYYNPRAVGTNHSITIIGWDDNFSADRFKTKPIGDGAWLVRNSYSTVSGNYMSSDGYFWMSYYDKSLAERAYSFEFDPADKYDHNYQYDGGIYTKTINSDSGKEIKGANVFSVPEDANPAGEYLKAVSFYTGETNESYSVKVFRGVSGQSNPENGTEVTGAAVSGRTLYAGLFAVDLAEPVLLNPGERFSVVVSLGKTGKVSSLGYESSYISPDNQFFVTEPSALKGQSFVYKNGWYDFGSAAGGNLRIKAFTTDNDDEPAYDEPEVIEIEKYIAENGLDIIPGDVYKLNTVIVPVNTSARSIVFSSSDTKVADVDKDGYITGKAIGEATITASLKNGRDSVSFVVRVSAQNSIILEEIGNIYYGDEDKSLTVRGIDGKPCEEDEIQWIVYDPSVISVEKNGVIVTRGVGKTAVRAKVGDSLSAAITVSVYARRVSCTLRLNDDNSVSVLWEGVPEAEQYVIKTRRGSSKAATETIDTVKGSDGSFEFRDMYYSGGVVDEPIRSYYCVCSEANKMTSGASYSSLIISGPYTVTYDMGGVGTAPESNPKKMRYHENAVLEAPEDTADTRGYRFDGWYLDPDYTEQVNVLTMESEDITVYARWEKRQGPYSVSYDLGGHGKNSDENPDIIWGGERIALHDAEDDQSTRGYIFEGWYLSPEFDEKIEVLETAVSDIMLYAHWVPDYEKALAEGLASADDTVAILPAAQGKKYKRVEPVSGDLTVNAGAKLYLQGIRGSYKIIDDDNGIRKTVRGKEKFIARSASVSKKGLFTAGKIKNQKTYDVVIEYEINIDGSRSETVTQTVHIQNMSIDRPSKLPVIISADPDSDSFSAIVSLRDSDIISGEWKIKDGSYYSKRKKEIIRTKQFAVMEVMPDRKSVKITAVTGRKGTAVISCSINGKKYKTKIRIKKQ